MEEFETEICIFKRPHTSTEGKRGQELYTEIFNLRFHQAHASKERKRGQVVEMEIWNFEQAPHPNRASSRLSGHWPAGLASVLASSLVYFPIIAHIRTNLR